MSPEKPIKKNQSTTSGSRSPATHRNSPSQGQGGGGQGRSNYGGGGRGGDRPNPSGGGGGAKPSPWLQHPHDRDPNPHAQASFVEYLRWARDPGTSADKNATKTELVDLALKADYRRRLKQLSDRTRKLASGGRCFEVTADWRVRVGGSKGPESMLLPAFDAMGMPYIPSSALRGVARAQAIRELMQKTGDRKLAEKEVAAWFGSLDAAESDRTGKVIFLDAYPLPMDQLGGLAADMANNIWSWDGDTTKYSPNPNLLLSLKASQFCVGLRPRSGCTPEQLEQVERWLRQGLATGVGSQVNSGYGVLKDGATDDRRQPWVKVKVTLEGQLIHGRQKFTQWRQNQNNGLWQMRGAAEAEARPIAFKSALRYWFRALGLGVLPAASIQTLEAKLFGAIVPKPTQGWLTVQLQKGGVKAPESQQKRDDPGFLGGDLLILPNDDLPEAHRDAAKELIRNLTWLAFRFGGVGQGARRPCYSRKSRPYAPWWRGNDLVLSGDSFWNLPADIPALQRRLEERLRGFYRSLQELTGQPLNLRSAGSVSARDWPEVVDSSARIVVVSGEMMREKPFALAILHDRSLNPGEGYNGDLCGQVRGGVKPSPVWIQNFRDEEDDLYQIVTVFGATQNPRRQYLDLLKQKAGGAFAEVNLKNCLSF